MFRQLAMAAFARAGVTCDLAALVDRFVAALSDRDAWQLYAEVPGVLARLRADGFVLGVVSNASSDLADFLRDLGVAGFFDFIVASAAEGTKKPDPRLFARALGIAGAAPDEVLHVGDLALEDVLGARRAGLDAVLIDRGSLGLFPSFPPALPPEAGETRVVRDLEELRRLLDGNGPGGGWRGHR
jgi:putative hydrolase of the HAD superfamily